MSPVTGQLIPYGATFGMLSCSRIMREQDCCKAHPLSRATPSAVSEHSSELIGYPISRSLTTCCVRLELRPLPSTGVTRLPRYCEPLRHPRAPGLSLAGVRLIIPDHALGPPVLRTLSLCTCRRHYPGTATGGIASLTSPQSCQPSLIWPSGRPVHRPFRGLLSVHSRYGLHTRAVTVYRDSYPKASATSSPP